MTNIPKSAKIGNNVTIETNVIIGKNVIIGHNTVILEGTQIGDNVEIGSNSVLGIKARSTYKMRKVNNNNKLIIEENVKIGHLVSIYLGSVIGKNGFIGDHASIRENVSINTGTVIGRAAIIELNSSIGKDCTIQTLAYITGDTVLEDNVFVGPCVSMSNDKYMGAKNSTLRGPIIEAGAKIGNNASLLPGVKIGKEVIVGAGSVVTKNIQDKEIVVGVPSKKING
ncbi:N-acetyltransferase [Priestia megaterium]|uniref:N-acetyltransferase n=1 Tax=Priestia megaterium TaxID=1404 RepID=UPI0005C6AC6D|nr:N-acetyltransferase [Priestia megaterium]